MKKSMALLASFLLMAFSVIAVAGELIDINTADKDTLANEVNGIGPTKAEAIIKHRQEKGPFASVDDLTNVSGIGDKTLEQIRDQITVGEESTKSQ